ncbi:hypothetical protein [Saccharothrix sp. NRRL B-16314]|uniref:hypothetical protein n=1 Tax=Saccharothrix sp. NRRL B-16314 TaxID=1463825 RepID=UPI001E4DCB1D|nr:hypothetical protein [Saccharothrix sp. NRRL B-16314]
MRFVGAERGGLELAAPGQPRREPLLDGQRSGEGLAGLVAAAHVVVVRQRLAPAERVVDQAQDLGTRGGTGRTRVRDGEQPVNGVLCGFGLVLAVEPAALHHLALLALGHRHFKAEVPGAVLRVPRAVGSSQPRAGRADLAPVGVAALAPLVRAASAAHFSYPPSVP